MEVLYLGIYNIFDPIPDTIYHTCRRFFIDYTSAVIGRGHASTGGSRQTASNEERQCGLSRGGGDVT